MYRELCNRRGLSRALIAEPIGVVALYCGASWTTPLTLDEMCDNQWQISMEDIGKHSQEKRLSVVFTRDASSVQLGNGAAALSDGIIAFNSALTNLTQQLAT